MHRRRRMTPTAPDVAQAFSEQDRYVENLPRFTAFLDQARWLLEQQQRLSDTFQQTAVALIGFDGVLLAILVSGDSLSSTGRYTISWWATVAGACLIVLSSIAGVMAIRPRTTHVAGAALTVDEWARVHKEPTWDRATQHFGEMLLAANPPLADEPTRAERLEAWWREKAGSQPLPRQPLLAAERLSKVRARRVSWSGWLLVAGLACLAITLAAEPANPAAAGEHPDIVVQDTARETGES